MALFNRDYDRNYGYRGSGRTGYGSDFGGADRGYNSTYNRGGYSSTPGYGQDFAGRGATGGYDRPYWGYDTARYDRNYKSRQQTNAGDPFGDRDSGTPMRVIDEPRDRGGWFGGRGYDRDMGYDRNYRGSRAGYGGDYRAANPMGYEPNDNRGGQRYGRTNDAGFRGNRGYDRDWF